MGVMVSGYNFGQKPTRLGYNLKELWIYIYPLITGTALPSGQYGV
jgi:hypothetical protein